MKLNGVGKAGIICLFVSSGISAILSLVIIAGGIIAFGIEPNSATVVLIFAIFAMIISIIIIILGALALVKGKQSLKIACGILGLISIAFIWIAYIFPTIIALVGGILTLCGKFDK